MSITYTITTNFGAKDSLPSNDPDKVVSGAEFTTEFTAIQSAFNAAAPAASPTFTGTVTFENATSTGDLQCSTLTATTEVDATLLTAATAAVGAGGLTVLGTATVTGDVAVDTDAFVVDTVNNRVGIGTTTPLAELHIESGSPGIRLYDSGAGDYGRFTYNGGDLFIQADDSNAVADSKIYFDIDGASVAEMLAGGGLTVVGNLTSANSPNWDAAYGDKVNSMSFSTSTGILTLNRQDGGTVTQDLDGRYGLAETGTWTPVLSSSLNGGGTLFTTSTLVGTYAKVGNVCVCTLQATITSVNGATTGALAVAGLPFNAASTGAHQTPIVPVTYTNVGTATDPTFYMSIYPSQKYGQILHANPGASNSVNQIAPSELMVGGDSQIYTTFMYITA